MFKRLFFIIAPVVFLVFYFGTVELVKNVTTDFAQPTQTRVEQYVTSNISELSPQKAVLGGTFYVTKILVGNKSGLVYYEDGHIALTADFSFIVAGDDIEILSFRIRSAK